MMLCCALYIQNLFISCKFVPWKTRSLFSHARESIILLSVSVSLAVLEATCKWHHMVFFFLQLISLSAMPSISIHVVANDRILLWWRLRLFTYLDYVLIHGSANIFLISSFHFFWFCCSSVTKSCPTLFDPMDCSTRFPVHHHLPQFAQTHVHWVGDTIQPSHLLSSPSPPALNVSLHQGLFQWVSSSYQVAKVLEFQLQHQSFQWTPRTDLL